MPLFHKKAHTPTPEDHVDPRAGDLAFCTRLLQVYRDLRSSNNLIAEPPLWTVEEFGDDLQQLTAPQQLQDNPRLQAALSGITSYTPSKWLLEQELSLRKASKPTETLWDLPLEAKALAKALEAIDETQLPPRVYPDPDPANPTPPSWSPGGEDVYDAAAREELAGLCFSGGGIRSATFNLGVLQGLASQNKLSRFDYLSTVSGGGYIHQWFASWIRNEPGRFDTVQRRLRSLPEPGSAARAPEQLTWLRRYSSYLTPQRGLLSADTWTMVAIWFRNTFLNQIVLFAFLAFCLLVANGILYLFTVAKHPTYVLPSYYVWWVLAAMLLSCGFLWRALHSQSTSSTPGKPAPGALSNHGVILLIVLPGFLLSAGVALETLGILRIGHRPNLLFCYSLYLIAVLFALTFGGRAVQTFHLLNKRSFFATLRFIAGVLVAILFCSGLSIFIAVREASFTAPWMVVQQAHSTEETPSSPPPCKAESIASTAPAIPTHPQESTAPKPAHAPIAASASSHPQKSSALKPSLAQSAAEASHDKLAESGKDVVKPKSTNLVTPFPTILFGHTFLIAQHLGPHLYRPGSCLTDKQIADNKAIYEADLAQAIYAIVSPVVFFGLLFLAMRLQLGLIGRYYTEERREWLARLGGWAAIFSVLWAVLSSISVLGPILCDWLLQSETTRTIGGLLAAALHAVTLSAGASGKGDGKPKPNRFFGYSYIDLISMIGAPLCILTILIIASGIVAHELGAFPDSDGHPLPFLLAFLVICVLLIFGWRVDVNEFSLHGFYRNRLARCYLGATNPRRSPDPFTGFDEHTEATTQSGMRLSELLPKRFGGCGFLQGEKDSDREPYDGPFPIFCSTLNLTFGADLAWQDRKGASFAFTPLLSGYHVGWTGAKGVDSKTTFNGYVPTDAYAYPGHGVHLATVTAISGAALSPNMGVNSQPAVAFLMTLFNVRLGWWIANPRRPRIWPSFRNRPTPRFGLRYLLSELFGLSDDTSNYVCLSDGGCFENMGLYELVRRRCMLLVICDAEEDSTGSFEGIGLAISKCRTDFGAEITLDLKPMLPATDGPNPGTCKQHFQVGTIQYPTPPGSTRPSSAYLGKVIYLKTSINGTETADILHYRRAFPNFPNDSTLNQWFTESQFESYRRLGQQIGEEINHYL